MRAESKDQLLQTGSTVVDERAERQDLPVLYIKEVGLDSLVGGDGKAGDVLLPGGEGLDRALPARLRMSVSRRSFAARSSIVTGMTNRSDSAEPCGARSGQAASLISSSQRKT